MSIFEPIFETLNAKGVRYIVVGGVAVVLHGHARLTIDIDLVVDLAPEEAMKAIEALTELGFVPSVPVDARGFADPSTRQGWIREKNMQVFPLRDPYDLKRRVDLFVEDPLPFDQMWQRATMVKYGGTEVRIAAVDDLIAMKRRAGRPQDIADIEALEEIERGYERGD